MHFATEFWLTRFCFQHSLGGIYLTAFLLAANQFIPLLGARGLQPVRLFARHVPFRCAPSLFYINCSDRFIAAMIWCGVALSCFALTGFPAIFLGSSDTRPPVIIMWLIVWLLFRTMFGAGMIKVRADPCWRDLTCRFYHYETQPLPNPLSWYLHHAPRWFHKAGVLFNHFTELIVPWFYFAPAPLCYWAGGITIVFQITLILSGNLSWLNYITIVLCIPCFDDRLLSRLLSIPHSVPEHMSLPQTIAVGFVTAIVLALSWRPARNLFSRRQLMNASFEPLHLVNTYGAFGAVTRERLEIVIKGTDAESADGSAEWREYQFKGKPGDVDRPPC